MRRRSPNRTRLRIRAADEALETDAQPTRIPGGRLKPEDPPQAIVDRTKPRAVHPGVLAAVARLSQRSRPRKCKTKPAGPAGANRERRRRDLGRKPPPLPAHRNLLIANGSLAKGLPGRMPAAPTKLAVLPAPTPPKHNADVAATKPTTPQPTSRRPRRQNTAMSRPAPDGSPAQPSKQNGHHLTTAPLPPSTASSPTAPSPCSPASATANSATSKPRPSCAPLPSACTPSCSRGCRSRRPPPPLEAPEEPRATSWSWTLRRWWMRCRRWKRRWIRSCTPWRSWRRSASARRRPWRRSMKSSRLWRPMLERRRGGGGRGGSVITCWRRDRGRLGMGRLCCCRRWSRRWERRLPGGYFRYVLFVFLSIMEPC